MRMVVLLPAPLGPRKPQRLPWGTTRSRSRTAWVLPKRLCTPAICIAASLTSSRLFLNRGCNPESVAYTLRAVQVERGEEYGMGSFSVRGAQKNGPAPRKGGTGPVTGRLGEGGVIRGSAARLGGGLGAGAALELVGDFRGGRDLFLGDLVEFEFIDGHLHLHAHDAHGHDGGDVDVSELLAFLHHDGGFHRAHGDPGRPRT